VYVQDPNFGEIVDFDYIHNHVAEAYSFSFPQYNLMGAAEKTVELSRHDPNYKITFGASGLAYSILLAAEEMELAERVKSESAICALGWTEEHSGSDLLSIRTQATPLPDDPTGRQFYIKGAKWMINFSFHADYHLVLAKVDPNLDGPRSLSFFLVPRAAIKNWERLETHVLRHMVLTKYEIDGVGTLVGKLGHGLSIVQRMALPSKYQCTYMGLDMVYGAVPAAIDHLSTKTIFKEHPLAFSNVFRQMYDIVLKAALYDFLYHRAVVFNTGGWLAFHGTLLKSFLLLRMNELLGKNLLVTGSKGYARESIIGREAIDSFILPVFDGHYTINTLMTAKHAERYINATDKMPLGERLALLRRDLFTQTLHDEINADPKDVRKPPFFDFADYIAQMELPFTLDGAFLMQKMRDLLDEIDDRGVGNDPDYKYKTGDLLHWLESIVGACELWKLTSEYHYLNAIVIQYNGFVSAFNTVISEGGMATDFITPLRQVPFSLDDIADSAAFLRDLLNIRAKVGLHAEAAGD